MSETTTTLAEVTIKGAGDYVNLLALQIDTKENTHGSLICTLRLETDNEIQNVDVSGRQIQAITREGDILFTGECIQSNSYRLAQYQELTLYAVTESYQADTMANSRTMQNPSKTMKQVAEQILGAYGALVQIKEDKTIPEPLVQDNETDWQFLVRIANQYGYTVYTNPASTVMQVILGNAGTTEIKAETKAEIIEESKNLQELRQKDANQGVRAGTYINVNIKMYKSSKIIMYNFLSF